MPCPRPQSRSSAAASTGAGRLRAVECGVAALLALLLGTLASGLPGGRGPRRDGERGVAVLLLTVLLSTVALSVAGAHFMQNRQHRFELMRQRAEVYARYCSEYAVARYGVPAFMQRPELADVNRDEQNWIEPRRLGDIMPGAFQGDDAAHSFAFGYDSLMMDKVFDLSSSKAFYFVSAQGVVTWSDGRGRPREARHRSALALTFSDFSRFMYFSNGEISPEGNQVYFGANEDWYGRVHVNGRAAISNNSNRPRFHGLFSQTADDVINLTSTQYEDVFLGGWFIPHPRIQWPPARAIDQIKELRTADHTYEASYEVHDSLYSTTHPLTTWIKFDRSQYWVAQYRADTLGAAGDTIYVPIQGAQNWLRRNLPTTPGRELIYVKGVCRLQGVVRGKVTVLASDSLFIMGDVITEDTDVVSCGSQERFGKVPLGSPNRIGLASENNIIIASTLANGFSNGANNGPTCALANDPVVSTCGQARKDVIITAALFAVACSYEAEFWNTTAWQGGTPPTGPQDGQCEYPGRPNICNAHARVWTPAQCPGASGMFDNRGLIWLCGSIVQTHRGFVIRNGNEYWGDRSIGYTGKVYRYDDNFLAGGPPVWFRVTYEDGSVDVVTEMVVPDYDRWRALRRQELAAR
ncbi:MAG: hypothetical protein Q8O14_10855 [bacterium]|jgi:hypothetical protein|nr:hypothetical protein [bacterium]